MNGTVQHVDLMLPSPSSPLQVWAAEELMARLGLPWRDADANESAGASVTLAVDCPLPEGAAGVAVGSDQPGDPMALARELATAGAEAGRPEQTAPDRFHLPIDLPGAYEAWLGRREEALDRDLDAKGRIQHANSALAAAAGDATPVAELLAETIYGLLDRSARSAELGLPPRRRPWPEGKGFAVHLSHDVDVLGGKYQLWRRYVGWSARYAKARLGGRAGPADHWAGKIRQLRADEDPEYTIPRWLEIEGRHNAAASFYFFCSRSGSTWRRQAGRMYRLTHPLAREAVALIARTGAEVGVHAFPGDHRSARRLLSRKALLEEVAGVPCAGVRQHHLYLAVPATWQAQHEAGFAYDATLGWPMNVGLRAGTCLPFETFDARSRRPIGMMEIPLIAMDGAMEMLWPEPETWLADLRPYLDAARAVGGVFSLLIHPNHLLEAGWPGQGAFYEAFLEEMNARGAWLTTGRDICRAARDHRAALRGKA